MTRSPSELTAYLALTTASGFVERPTPGILSLAGDGAAEFLQGQLTNDIEALAVGRGCYALLLTPKGKIRAEMRVVRTTDELLIIADRTAGVLIRKAIETFRIGYRFELHDRSQENALLSVIGPGALSALATVSPANLEPLTVEHKNAPIGVGTSELLAIVTDIGVDLIGDGKAIDAAIAAFESAGIPSAPHDTAEILRVETGRPRFGAEIDTETIPQEAGLNERAVNFEKGCYVGQETVARLHWKGRPNRHLRGLRLEAPAAVGAAVTAVDGRELGRVGTVVNSPRHGTIALAILRREVEPGDAVNVGGVGVGAIVVDSGDFADGD